ncbi:exocyst subunit SEC5 [Kluyveromyces lactis]|uniref:Exocyst complex component SEC5 n=1 Tax=Kluyveromyces lactis (strain ATCC 8585 / CBS 2359 / DSM 70799 / NBRC 1267 / NRRL Y-1140 / WM37) TaxID=284590 RepID=Q6CQH1_KLULA|nr:uncharacterized protein KLLA0_D17138g [Kluyveromyces lactis]CAH00914.1 KLLA0D17138p [Kluyveromyces lactis]|eukprot:XP_453818.1 uncharacterized protein KLLA0_D17138g [Kluyveromyces lactis]
MNGSFDVSEDQLLQFYHLNSLNPSTSWKDDSTLIYQLEDGQWEQDNLETSYAVLNDLLQQEHEFNRKKGSGANSEREDVEDPLNPSTPAMELLRRVSNDPSSNNSHEYLISSKSFKPKLYLKKVHPQDTFEQLTKSLDVLDKSLQEQSYELKQLVQTNFAKYVRSKSNLDHIYKRFDTLMNSADAETYDEDELSVQRLNENLNETMKQTSLKLQPLLSNNDKLQKFQWAIQFVNENRYFFDLPRLLKNLLLNKDYTNLMFEYEKAQTAYKSLSARNTEDLHINNDNSVIEKIWNEVELIMDRYRKYSWAKLLMPPAIGSSDSQEVFLPLLSKLIDLKVTENPIIMWIDTRMNNFQDQLKRTSSQMIENITHSTETLLENSSGNDLDLHFYLSMNIYSDDATVKNDAELASTPHHALMVQRGLTDVPAVVETWLLTLKFMNGLNNISTSFVEFWEHVERFLDNTYQTMLLNERKQKKIIESNDELSADDGAMLRFSEEEAQIVKRQGSSFINAISKVLLNFFRSTQENIGIENVPLSKDSGTPLSYGFIPLRSNCLSCLRYLPKIADPIFRFTTELAQLAIDTESIETLRKLDAFIIDRCVSAISSTRLRDLSLMYVLEDWEVYDSYDDDRYSITQFPEIARSLQEYSIQTLHEILFFYEKLPVIKGISIIGYPSKQLLTSIEIQQVVSMESVLESVLKNATKDKDNPRNSHTVLTLNNLKHIKSQTFPKVLNHFDEAFEMSLSSKNLELYNLLAKMESSIFGNYLSDLKFSLRDKLEDKFHDINWSAYTSNSFRVSDYIIETLMVLISTHSECFRIGPQLIERILKETQVFMAKYLFEAFKPYIGNISSDGLLQVTVDLCFFEKVLKGLLVEDTRTIIMACLQNCFQNDVPRMQRIIKETEPIVNSNLDRTKIQFASLK